MLAACDASPSRSPATQAPGPTTGASAAPAGTAGPIATQTVDVRLPPGAQFDPSSTSIPGESEPVATQFLTRAYFFATRDGHPIALYREGTPWLETVIDDGAGYKPPAGSSLQGGYFRVVDAAANDGAMVVLGSAKSRDADRPTGFDVLPESLIWVTRDGKSFERIDPRTLVDDASSLQLISVVATGKGFVVVGNVLPTGLDARVRIVVLQSPDGASWTVADQLKGAGTLSARRLFVDRDRLLIDATDQLCDRTSTSYPYGLRTGVTRAWTSPDAGASWDPVNLSQAEPVLHQPDASLDACPANPKLGDLIAISQQSDTEGSIVGLGGDVLVARSRDGTMLAVGRDLALQAWTQVALPGAIPIPADGHRPYAQSIVFEFDGTISIVALEDRDDAAGRPRSGGCQVRWWRSADSGATWSSGPWGRPFSTCSGATWSFEQLRDSSALLFANSIIANTNRGEASFRTSAAGAFVSWDTCVPKPEADCAFATITKPTSEAPGWPGIDLSGATLTEAAIPGVQMPKVKGYAALLSGTFGAADLSEGLLSYAVLEGDFRGSNLRDANLFHAIIRADLTGANLDGAELTGLTFGAGAVCPDGTAPTAGTTDAKAACRL